MWGDRRTKSRTACGEAVYPPTNPNDCVSDIRFRVLGFGFRGVGLGAYGPECLGEESFGFRVLVSGVSTCLGSRGGNLGFG